MTSASKPELAQPLQPPSSHYENFPVASLLCPPRLRPAVAAIYWFARTADDIADEGDTLPARRLAALAAFRGDLLAAADGRPASARWPAVFAALAPVMAEFQLPVALLDNLLSAFEQDVVKQRYASESELHDYCRRSANPVGRLLLHLYAVSDAASLAQSDHICTALQLINFWQDLSVDIPRGRIYLPQELWAVHGVDETQLQTLEVNPATTELIAACAHSARAHMLKGIELPVTVARRLGGFNGWRAALELRCVIQGGLRILDKIEAQGFNTLQQRPTLTPRDVVVMGWRALRM